jgi:hypothetical protein
VERCGSRRVGPAPHGAQLFLDMVKSNYFQGSNSNEQDEEEEEEDSSGVPLMRYVRNFLRQFGLVGKRSERLHPGPDCRRPSVAAVRTRPPDERTSGAWRGSKRAT